MATYPAPGEASVKAEKLTREEVEIRRDKLRAERLRVLRERPEFAAVLRERQYKRAMKK